MERHRTDAYVTVLTDLWSVSMGELTTAAIQCLPYSTVIGETTWGGHGPLYTNWPMSFTGQFGDINQGHFVYTSHFETRNLDGQNYEGRGITPDIEVLNDLRATLSGNDPQLNKAIEVLNEKTSAQ